MLKKKQRRGVLYKLDFTTDLSLDTCLERLSHLQRYGIRAVINPVYEDATTFHAELWDAAQFAASVEGSLKQQNENSTHVTLRPALSSRTLLRLRTVQAIEILAALEIGILIGYFGRLPLRGIGLVLVIAIMVGCFAAWLTRLSWNNKSSQDLMWILQGVFLDNFYEPQPLIRSLEELGLTEKSKTAL